MYIHDIVYYRMSLVRSDLTTRTNSKATLRVPLNNLLPIVPAVFHSAIRASRYCTSKSDSIVIQADDSRKQSDNIHSCYERLHDMIVQACSSAVPGKTSDAQKARIKAL